MQVRTDIQKTDDPEELAATLRALTVAHVCAAIEQLKRYAIPDLYKSGVRYKPEAGAGSGIEDFALPLTVLARGWGDCDDLAIWRCAELCRSGQVALPKIYWRVRDGRVRVYHAECRILSTGRVEDPSRLLGM
jgi:hypothetical protein